MMKEPELKEALKFFKLSPLKIEALKGDGSNRKFFRLHFKKGSLILILPQQGIEGIEEARRYAVIGSFLHTSGIPVPEIKDWGKEKGYLLVEDLGDLRLFEAVKFCEDGIYHYFEAVELLATLQRLSWKELCHQVELKSYEKEFIYEKEVLYGAQNLGLSFEKLQHLREWVEEVSRRLKDFVLMHRDFQSKNFMLKKGKLYLIDFQGMMLGPPSYDLSALVYDPYVELKEKIRREIIKYYQELTGRGTEFEEELKDVRCFRLFQALGAFYKLSSQGKSWFAQFITPTLKLLKSFLSQTSYL